MKIIRQAKLRQRTIVVVEIHIVNISLKYLLKVSFECCFQPCAGFVMGVWVRGFVVHFSHGFGVAFSDPNLTGTPWKLVSIQAVEVSSPLPLSNQRGQIQPWIALASWDLKHNDLSSSQMGCVGGFCLAFLWKPQVDKWKVGDTLQSISICSYNLCTTIL